MDDDGIELVANRFYTVYCKTVGGKSFNGDPLPDWKTFRADPTKIKQSDGWIAVARFAVKELCQ